MSWVRASLVVLLAFGGTAAAQPADPYGPAPAGPPAPAPPPAGPAAPATPPAGPAAPTPAPPTPLPPPSQDPVLNEQVAQALVARAQELLDARVWLDAKQLAVEALVRSPRGASADHARMIIHTVNQQLGIPEDAPKPEPPPEKIEDPVKEHPTPPEPGALPSGKWAASVHGGLYLGGLGTTIGSFFSSSSPAKGAVPTGIGLAAVGALVTPMVVDKIGWSEAQVRTVGSGTVWGGVIGGMIADIGKLHGTTAREVLVGTSIGSTVAGAGAALLARENHLTRGDVALIDTLAGVGTVGGLTLGMLMQPAQGEAYDLNSVIGCAGGVIIGMIAAPQTNTTPRRMMRVAGIAAIGGGAPFLLYAAIHDKTTNSDERITGLLSTTGLLVGTYFGFRWTDGMDDGLDTLDGKRKKTADDAPIALVGRSSDGSYQIGGLGLTPLSPALAPQKGMALQLFGAAF